MNKEEPYRNQAEKTKQKIEKLNEQNLDPTTLPPRSQIHRDRKKKTKWKMKYPLIRLLALFFILLPITIFSIYSYLGSRHFNSQKVSVSSNKGYETVDFQGSKKTQSKKDGKNTGLKSKSNNDAEDQLAGSETKQASVPENQAAAQAAENTTAVPAGPATDKSNAPGDQSNTASIPKMENKVLYHTVQRKETLTSIARKYYQSPSGVETIKTANHLHSDTISVGQVLKIPLNN